MSCEVLVGGQWGDEGKAKAIDFLSDKAKIVIRYQGGANAGHTVIYKNKTIVFHLVPSGILYPDKICVIANGLVVDPEALMEEIDSLKKYDVSVKGRLFLSDRAHVVFPFHKIMDGIREESLGDSKLGTTKRGIGPTYADKMARVGIRVADLYVSGLKEKIENALKEKNILLTTLYKQPEIKTSDMLSWAKSFADQIQPYVIDTHDLIHKAIDKDDHVLLEGAQGCCLDIDHGTYPYVTSSNSSASGACAGSGISPRHITKVIAIMKAYLTRVGSGPFPSECLDDTGQRLREVGKEYGATTGRPRRCGWFDEILARYSSDINGFDEIFLTKLDILSHFDEIKVVEKYIINGEETHTFPSTTDQLDQIKVVHKTFPGWKKSIEGITSYNALPDNARRYIESLEESLNTKIAYISVGPKREETIVR